VIRDNGEAERDSTGNYLVAQRKGNSIYIRRMGRRNGVEHPGEKDHLLQLLGFQNASIGKKESIKRRVRVFDWTRTNNVEKDTKVFITVRFRTKDRPALLAKGEGRK